jgi:hypothetical protein
MGSGKNYWPGSVRYDTDRGENETNLAGTEAQHGEKGDVIALLTGNIRDR